MDDGTDAAPERAPLPHWWSLPPAPEVVRDWRWALGVLGRVFITLGLLIISFVGYQLWGTGIEFRNNQDHLRDQVREFQESLGVSTVAPVVTVPSTTTAGSTVAGSSTTFPAVTPPPVTLPPIDLGDPVGTLKMPTISGSTLVLVAGVRVPDLKKGVGHYPGTPLPGQYGNAALAGHRTTYGAPFENLDKLKVGDRLIVDTLLGEHYEYIVDGQEIVTPHDTGVLSQPTDRDTATLTLTTCHPKRSTKKRLIIHSHLDLAASSPPTARTRNYAPAATGVVGEDGDPSASTVTPTTPAPTAVTPTTGSGAVTSLAPATTTAVTTTTAPVLAGEDAEGSATSADSKDLARGWFHDSAAWGQLVLWGGLLVLISVVSWWLGRRFANRWIGPVVIAAPFLVLLYFFFQNVNRLLPPGL